jgi:hypothetical protein
MNIDEKIKEALMSDMLKIEDANFSARIIQVVSSQKVEEKSFKPFPHFQSLLIGLVAILTSLGLLLVPQINDLTITIKNYDATPAVILFSISVVFVLHKLLEEIVVRKPVRLDS